MKATVTDRVGITYEVELEFGGVDDDGLTVMIGRLPIPMTDVVSARVDVIPAKTSVQFVGTA